MSDQHHSEVLVRLHTGLRSRRTPQEVAVDLVNLDVHQTLTASAARQLTELARHARGWFTTGSSMPDTWRTHPGLHRSALAAQRALDAITTAAGRDRLAPVRDAGDPAELAAWTRQAVALLGLPDDPSPARGGRGGRDTTVDTGWGHYELRRRPRGRRGDTAGHADPRQRMDAATRRATLPGVSVRTYRRAVAATTHLQQRTAALAAERDRETATAFGKARLAHTIPAQDFAADLPSAAFVAYYTARLGQRTVFTDGPQARPMDDVAAALLTAALASPTRRADVIAAVLTRQSVLSALTDAQRGQLLGTYYEQLAACARALRGSFDPHRDRTAMVVRAGDDSSTWNAASRAFNSARTGWLNLTAALGLEHVVARACPGKVPALVAADVAHWHTLSGGAQHADVAVFAELPLPWDVVLDGAACPAELVAAACGRHGIDAEGSGWTKGYRQDALAVTEPAPDLVHGVAVSSPLLAGLLRDAGVFSGQARTARQDALLTGLLIDLTDGQPTTA